MMKRTNRAEAGVQHVPMKNMDSVRRARRAYYWMTTR